MGEKKASFRGQVVRRPLRKGKIAGSNPVESTIFLLGLFLLQYVSNVRFCGDKFYSMYQMSE